MPFKSPCEPYRLFKNSGPNPSKMTMESLQPTKFHASNSPENQLRPLKNKGFDSVFRRVLDWISKQPSDLRSHDS